MVYRLRRQPESSLDLEQIRFLIKDSCRRARKEVPNVKLQKKICQAAKMFRKKNNNQPLSKRQLEELDMQFLARGSRKPDAEIVRWVLRCARLHPQGRVVK